jgi:hypothetical protein
MDDVARLGEKTVFVRSYLRLRLGKWQTVKSHFRKPRRK